MSLKIVQTKLKDAGYYDGDIDGLWGNMSAGALDTLIADVNHYKPKVEIKPSGYKLSAKSLEKLSEVHSDLQRVVKHAIEITTVDFTVGEGMRNIARQRELVRKGASKTMNSRHLTGHAVDLIALDDNGKVSWDWPLYYKIETAMKQAAKDVGVSIEWGGDWKSFKDGPHYQLPWSKYPK